MNYGRALHNVLEFSHQLDVLHKHMTESNLPVRKSDSFDRQCFLLEQHLGEDVYQTTYKKMKKVNLLSGITALPVLLVIAVAYIYSRWIDKELDMFGFFIDHPVLYLVPAVLIVVTLVLAVYHSILRKKLYYRIYPELKSRLHIQE